MLNFDLGSKRTYFEEEEREDEYHYWFRLLNNGKSPLDNQPLYKEYMAYKQHVADIEKSAFDTLKLTVNKLLSQVEGAKSKNTKT
jgi:hypothetical protein